MRAIACVLAMSICLPAMAGRHKSLSECTTFGSEEKGEDKLELSIKNTCTVPVDCSISWRVVCAPGSKRRNVHASSSALAIAEGGVKSAEASAEVCGDDAWAIENIEWSCQPQ